jgi:hypothetical protein
MASNTSTKMDFIPHHFLHKLLWLVLMLVAMPLMYGPLKLADFVEDDGRHTVLAWMIRLPLIVLFLSTYWLSGRITDNITINKMGFWSSVKAGFQDVRFGLGCLPLVGGWFFKSKDKQEDRDDEV